MASKVKRAATSATFRTFYDNDKLYQSDDKEYNTSDNKVTSNNEVTESINNAPELACKRIWRIEAMLILAYNVVIIKREEKTDK